MRSSLQPHRTNRPTKNDAKRNDPFASLPVVKNVCIHRIIDQQFGQFENKHYLDYMQDAFIINKSVRYDIKGRHYIDTPAKYYFEDLGLRNARLQFRQTEETHLMENLIFNELRIRGYSVDVGQLTIFGKDSEGKSERRQLEVDFVCNKGYERLYIQSAFSLPTPEKQQQEFNSLKRINDSFQKIVIVGGMLPTYRNDDGILILNVFDFLLNKVAI